MILGWPGSWLFPFVGRDDGRSEVFPVALHGRTRGYTTPNQYAFVQHQNGLRVNEARKLLENRVSIAAFDAAACTSGSDRKSLLDLHLVNQESGHGF
jgi:hypothetical protein